MSIWTEKYRPRNINNTIGQEEVISFLNNSLENGELPHLIFYGSSGVGKTSVALSLSKTMYPENYRDNVLELNASDERGINTVRTKIKKFAKKSVNTKQKYKFKLIILDEADSLTSDSQFILRRIIERYSHITRFCLICNYIENIIDPLLSRCCLFRFKNIDNLSIKNILNNIVKKEKLKVNSKMIDQIIKSCNKDLRKAINKLQKISYFNEDIEQINIKLIYELLEIKDKKLLLKKINLIHRYNYNIEDILEVILDWLLKSKLSDKIKSNISQVISDVDFNLQLKSDNYIQLIYLFFNINRNLIK